MMLNCKETVRLISEKLDRHLSWWQRMNLWAHVMMCGACSAYNRQLEGLERVFKFRRRGADETVGSTAPENSVGLSGQRRTQIKRMLQLVFSEKPE